MTGRPQRPHRLVILLDVDNTLLNNDMFQIELRNHLTAVGGPECRDRYWAIQEELMHTLGYRDYLGAFQRYRLEYPQDRNAIWLATYVVSYGYARLLYPGALALLEQLGKIAPTVLLTDGDAVFQPRKLESSGLAAAVEGRVMIAVHKEQSLADIEERYPAEHYVVIDDKLRLLTAIKAVWGSRVTTVFPMQGQFAFDAKAVAALPPADITVSQIGDLLDEARLSQLCQLAG